MHRNASWKRATKKSDVVSPLTVGLCMDVCKGGIKTVATVDLGM